MATRGVRNTTSPIEYGEPTLLRNVKDLLKLAEDKGCYDNDQLNLDRLINAVSNNSTMCENCSITVRYVPMDPAVSGSLDYNNGVWTISVNELHNRRRQNYTMAHELAHYMMHRNTSTRFEDSVFFRSTKMSTMEYSANEFAAKLLMPEDRVRKAISEGMKNIGKLAERFGVSSQAMLIRAKELGYKMKQDE